jgi:gamma-glutamylcyclotransferase (GGCT)/AIG2-like uncharacterized protein YtfP
MDLPIANAWFNACPKGLGYALRRESMKKYYLAYGSNMNVQHMALLCPTAKFLGGSELAGWKLKFRDYATVEPSPGDKVPVVVWEISSLNEDALDRYEGYPSLYTKTVVHVILNGKKIEGMLYVMNVDGNGNEWPIREPREFYYEKITRGYLHAGLDLKPLRQALTESRQK